MKTFLIILAIYWVAVIVSTYIIRHFNGKKPLNQFFSSFPNQKKESKWMHPFIVFLHPIVLPFLLLGVGIGTLVEWKPRMIIKHMGTEPSMKELRKALKRNRLLDRHYNLFSLDAYNKCNGTNYTPEDIYDKDFLEALKNGDLEKAEALGKIWKD